MYFEEKIVTLRSKIGKPKPIPEEQISEGKFTKFEPITQERLRKLIMNSPSKSCSLDPMPTWLLKEELESLLPIITTIVNLSFEENTFPRTWKIALILPIFKRLNLLLEVLKNYRPISNLVFLST